MANIQKSSKSGLKGSDNDNEAAELPQVIEIKHEEDINKYSANELKEKIEHLKNVFKNSNGNDKDVIKSLDKILYKYDDKLNNNVVMPLSPGLSSSPQIKKDLHKYAFVDSVNVESEEEEVIEPDSDEDMPPLESNPEKEYKYNKSKKIDEDFIKSLKKQESESMVEIDTDGLDHETYAGVSYKNRIKMGKSIGFCETCNKYYPDFIVVEHDGMPYCWHCLFWLTSTSMFGDKELEQTYGLSLEKYIEFCGPSHNKVDCIRSAECVLCNNSLDNFETLPASDDEDSTEDLEDLVLELDI